MFGFLKHTNKIEDIKLGIKIKLELKENEGFIFDEYTKKGKIVKISKNIINTKSYFFRCYFEDNEEEFVQVYVTNDEIEKAVLFKRFDYLEYNDRSEMFVDRDGDESPEELWLEELLIEELFIINESGSEFDLEEDDTIPDGVYVFELENEKEVTKEVAATKKEEEVNVLTESLYQRDVDGDKELVLLSHSVGEKKEINIYVGYEIPMDELKID